MHLLQLDDKESVWFPLKKETVIGTDFDCDIQINHADLQGKHFVIIQYSYGCVLRVLVGQITINNIPINKQSLIEPGEIIQLNDLKFRLVDDQFIPKDSVIDLTQVETTDKTNQSAVFGLRAFDQGACGQFIIDNFHHPDGWHVIRHEDELHFINNSHKTVLNGQVINQATLRNGDVMVGNGYKYKVELPGTSGYSKFSPSHPKNILLSEQLNDESSQAVSTSPKTFMKSNLWWLTILAGLILILLLVITNSPQT